MSLTLKVTLSRPRSPPAIAKTLPPTFQTCEPPHWTTCEVATSFRQKALYSASVTLPSAQLLWRKREVSGALEAGGQGPVRERGGLRSAASGVRRRRGTGETDRRRRRHARRLASGACETK